MMPPSAHATTPNTCALIARGFTPNSPVQINAADQLHQMIQRKIYAACLQTRGKQGASRMTAPVRAGTNTTNAGTFVVFDPPGSIYTQPNAINPAGTVAGTYLDAGGLEHSFLRTSDGTITPFDPPAATCSPTQPFCSLAAGIAPDGTIVGSYAETGLLFHGYLRAPKGAFTVFDAPGSQFTLPAAINPAGTITSGFYTTDFTGGEHGFIRASNGTITTFDPLGSTSTNAPAINPAGTVTGSFSDARGVWHGFLRTSDGTITVFDPPGSVGTFPAAINPAGTIVGNFNASLSLHGFLRASNGTFTVFDLPGAGFTFPLAINPAGAVTGNFNSPVSSGDHGFVVRPKNMR
jgi:uncharacterized membrane protein